jgi:septum formation protein
VPRLVLASTSPYRRALLERLGVPFVARAPACDEEALRDPGLSPRALAEHLASKKAESLLDAEPGATILGGDQLAAIGDVVLGKPGTPEAARAQLATLAGKTHELFTAIAVLHEGRAIRHLDVARLSMRPLDPDAIARYVAADAPTDCAGSYRIEGRGIALFDRIACDDHTAIVGLPLIALTRILVSLGFAIP